MFFSKKTVSNEAARKFAQNTPLNETKNKTIRINEEQIKSIAFVITGSNNLKPKKEDSVVYVLRQGFNGVISALGGKTRLTEGRPAPSSASQTATKENSLFSNFLKGQEQIERRREIREREAENRRRAESRFPRREERRDRDSSFDKIYNSLNKIFAPFTGLFNILGAMGGLIKLFAVAWIAKPDNFVKLKNVVGAFLKAAEMAAGVLIKVFQNLDKVVIGFLIFKALPLFKMLDGAIGKFGSVIFKTADGLAAGLGRTVNKIQDSVNSVFEEIKETGKLNLKGFRDYNRELKKEVGIARALFDRSSKHHKRAVELYTKRMISGAQLMFNSAVSMSKKVSGAMFTGIKGISAVFLKLLAPLLLIAPLFEAFRKELEPLFQDFGNIFQPIMEALQGAVREIIPQITNIMGMLGKFIANIAPSIGKFMTTILKIVARLAETILPIVFGLFEKLLPVFEELVNALMPVFSDFLNELSKVFQELAITVVPVLVDLIKDLIPVITGLLKDLLPAVSEILKAMVPILSTMIRVFSVLIKTVLPPLVIALRGITWVARGLAMGLNFVATTIARLFGVKLRDKIEERDQQYEQVLRGQNNNQNSEGKYPISDAGSTVTKSGLVYVSAGEIILSNDPNGKTITTPTAVPNQPAEIKPIDRQGLSNQVKTEALSARLNNEEAETLGEAMKLPYQAVLGGLVGLSEGFVRTLGPAAAPVVPFLKRRINQMVSRIGLPSEVKMNYNPSAWGSTSPDNTGQGFSGAYGGGSFGGGTSGESSSGRSEISNQYFSRLLGGSSVRGGSSNSSSNSSGNIDYGELSKGVELIEKYESFRENAYPDPIHGWKVPTIGYGFTTYLDGRKVKPGDKITKEEAKKILKAKIENYVKILSERIPVWNELKPEQKSALLSFAFNLGAYFYGSEGFETITKHLKEKNWQGVAESFFLYRNRKTSSAVGLGRRRCSEARLWNMGLGKNEYPSVCKGEYKPTVQLSFSKGGNFLVDTYNWIKNKIFGERRQQPQNNKPTTPLPPSFNEFDIAKNFIELKEGFRENAYPDPIHGWKVPTIGYGFTYYEDGTRVKSGDRMTRDRGKALLDWFLKRIFNDLASKIPYWNEMTKEQKAALLSFGFNFGTGFFGNQNFKTITRRLRNKEWMLMDEAFVLYRNPGESVEFGLGKRRCSESRLWNLPLNKTTLPKLCDRFGSEPPQKFLKKFSMGGSYFDFNNVSILGQTLYPSGAIGVHFSAPSGGAPVVLAGQKATVHGLETAIFASNGYSDPMVFIEPIKTMHSHTIEANKNKAIADYIKFGYSFSIGGQVSDNKNKFNNKKPNNKTESDNNSNKKPESDSPSASSENNASATVSVPTNFEHGMKEFTTRLSDGVLERDENNPERAKFGIPGVQGTGISNLSLAGGIDLVKQYNGYYAKHPNGVVVRIGDLFRANRSNKFGFHTGIDIPAHLGKPESFDNARKVPYFTPVKVKIALIDGGGNDNGITMTLLEPLKTSKGTLNKGAQIRYVHTYRPMVKVGDIVEAGKQVALGADTSRWRNLPQYSHMHLELYESESSSFINPAKYFSPAELVSFPFTGKGIGLSSGSSTTSNSGEQTSTEGEGGVQSPQEMAKKAILAVACALEAARGGEPSEMCKRLMEEGGSQPQQSGSDSVSSDSASEVQSPSESTETKDSTKIKEPKAFSKLLKRLYDAKLNSKIATFFKEIKSLATGYFVSVVGKKLSYKKIEDRDNILNFTIREGNIDNLIRRIDKKDPKQISTTDMLSYYFAQLFKEKEKNRDNFGGILVPTELDKLPTPEMNPENFEINMFRAPKLDTYKIREGLNKYKSETLVPISSADSNLRLMFYNTRSLINLLGGMLQFHVINSVMGNKFDKLKANFNASNILKNGSNYALFNTKTGKLVYGKPVQEGKLSFSSGGTVPKTFIMTNPKNYKKEFDRVNNSPIVVVNNQISQPMSQPIPMPVQQSSSTMTTFNPYTVSKSELNNFAVVNNFYV